MKKTLVNLVLVIFISSFFSGDSLAKTSKKAEKLAQEQKQQVLVEGIKVYYLGQQPNRKYEIISPLSDTSKTEQKSFLYMKEAAADVEADAIIDFECKDEKRLKFGWTAGQQSFANCRGKAVKWIQ